MKLFIVSLPSWALSKGQQVGVKKTTTYVENIQYVLSQPLPQSRRKSEVFARESFLKVRGEIEERSR